MTDYERGIRDAMGFYFSHSVRVTGVTNGSSEATVVPASEQAREWFKKSGQEKLMVEAAVAALVHPEAAR